MKTSENYPTQSMILYWEWKEGHFVSNLALTLEYARVSQPHDVYWLELEIAKRCIGVKYW